MTMTQRILAFLGSLFIRGEQAIAGSMNAVEWRIFFTIAIVLGIAFGSMFFWFDHWRGLRLLIPSLILAMMPVFLLIYRSGEKTV